jgi:hypothetical protein
MNIARMLNRHRRSLSLLTIPGPENEGFGPLRYTHRIMIALAVIALASLALIIPAS